LSERFALDIFAYVLMDNHHLIWHPGLLTNERIGAIFDLTYSSVSHSVKAVKFRMAKENKLRDFIKDLNSQFKV